MSSDLEKVPDSRLHSGFIDQEAKNPGAGGGPVVMVLMQVTAVSKDDKAAQEPINVLGWVLIPNTLAYKLFTKRHWTQ